MTDHDYLASVTLFRNDLPHLFNRLGLNGIGVEVGVQRGEYARVLLENWKGERVYLVDSWRQIPGYMDLANFDHNGQLDNLARTFMNVYAFQERAVIIRDFSVPAAKMFQDKSLDFVFLDGDHSYKGVQNDIEAWYPKMKEGGVFCGHDYLDSSWEENQISELGVKRAVDEWAASLGKKVYTTKEEIYPFWWTVV